VDITLKIVHSAKDPLVHTPGRLNFFFIKPNSPRGSVYNAPRGQHNVSLQRDCVLFLAHDYE